MRFIGYAFGMLVGMVILVFTRYWMWAWAALSAVLLQYRVGNVTSSGRPLDFWPTADIWQAETMWVAVTMFVLGGAVLVGGLQRAMHARRDSWQQSGFFGSRFVYIVAPLMLAMSMYAVFTWSAAGVHDWRNGLMLLATVGVQGAACYLAYFGYLRRTKGQYEAAQLEQFPGAAEVGADVGAPSPARVSRPRLRFEGIYGNEAIKERLGEAAQKIVAARRGNRVPRNGIILFGQPGNGKTIFAEALAGELKLPLVTVTYADVASMWVGAKSEALRGAFGRAIAAQPSVLFIDEIDSFIADRTEVARGVKEDHDLTNAMLTMLVDIRRHKVIVLAATNYMDRLDAAAVREGRFDFKVEITPPDEAARIGLLRKGLADNLPGASIDGGVLERVARRWIGFSVKRILSVAEELPAYLRAVGRSEPEFGDFMGALRQLQGQRGVTPENVKPLSDLVLSSRTRGSLDLIAGRMADPEYTERHGGTLPTRVLFMGPPGTGKTAACKALANEIAWAFLPTTGADLARDTKGLEALYAKAKDLRPTLIFIDEADELLRDRAFSGGTEATNKLLTLMDGVGDRVRDVVWIAATNHPDQIDPALLRGGRFAEKVVFDMPSASDLVTYVSAWCTQKRIALEPGLTAVQVARHLGESSIANAEAILQAAVNRAIARREPQLSVRSSDVEEGVHLIQGGG
jgi:transitional endoplasmic reticulum ATPase